MEQGLGPRDVHIWLATVDPGDPDQGESAAWRRLLDEEERARAGRFRFRRDRRRFIFRRGVLRLILGGYLEQPAATLQFARGAYGKPFLAPGLDGADLTFNLSFSRDVVLVGVTRGRPIGVDVEFIQESFDIGEVAPVTLTAEEREAIEEAAPAARPAAFFRIWTRKEAYVKGIGKGLSMPLTAVDVRESPIVVRRPGGAPQPLAWVCRDLDLVPGYAAAVAVQGDDWIVTHRRWGGAARSPVENER